MDGPQIVFAASPMLLHFLPFAERLLHSASSVFVNSSHIWPASPALLTHVSRSVWVVAQSQAAPRSVSPCESFGIDNFSGSVNAFRQEPRNRIRHWLVLVDDVKVSIARKGKGLKSEITVRRLHGPVARTMLVYQAQGDGFCRRRPDAKITAIAGKVGAERGSHGVAKSAVGHVC